MKGDTLVTEKMKEETRYLLELYQGLDEVDVNSIKTGFPTVWKGFEGDSFC